MRGHEGDERVPAVRVARVRPPVGHVGAPQHVVLQRQAATGAVGALELRYVASDLEAMAFLSSIHCRTFQISIFASHSQWK